MENTRVALRLTPLWLSELSFFSIWRKALNRSAINSWSKMWKIQKVITNLTLRFSSCFLWAWISISFYYLLLEQAELYNENICCKKCQILYLCLLMNFEPSFCRTFLKQSAFIHAFPSPLKKHPHVRKKSNYFVSIFQWRIQVLMLLQFICNTLI